MTAETVRWLKKILMIVSIGICGPLMFFSGGEMTSVKVTPSASSVKVGKALTYQVEITPDGEIAGGQLNFKFNPQAMKVDSVVQGPFLGGQSFWNGGTIDNVAGLVKDVYGVVTTPGQAISTKGVFVTFNCTALAAGKTSDIALENVILGNKEGVSVPFDLSVDQVVFLAVYDLDGNGQVDVADLVIAASQFGTAGPADFNGDATVDILDLIILVQNFT